jgi:hypothetical protein
MPSFCAITQDPISTLISHGLIAWGDVPSSVEENIAFEQWCETGETATMLNTIRALIPRKRGSSKKLRWTEEVVVIAPTVTDALYNTLLPSEMDIITPEMFHAAENGRYSQKLMREFPECASYTTVSSSEYSALKPWQAPQVQAVFQKWFPHTSFHHIIDATAHIGADTINLANMYPSALIDAYEVNLDAFVALHKNIITFNKLDTIRTHWRDINSWKPLPSETIDLIYADPPWGGIGFDRVKELELYFQEENAKPCEEKNVNRVIDRWFLTGNVKNVVMKVPFNYSKVYLQSKYTVQEMPILNRAGRVAYTLLYIKMKLDSLSVEAPVVEAPVVEVPIEVEHKECVPSVQRLFDSAKKKSYNKAKPIVEVPSIQQAPNIKTVIVRNLPRDITASELSTIFQAYGPITDIYIPMNKDRSSPYYGTIKGFALVKYSTPDHSLKAFIAENTMHARMIRGKRVTTEFAKEDK